MPVIINFFIDAIADGDVILGFILFFVSGICIIISLLGLLEKVFDPETWR
jgi:hypothetical protein